jgi:hypothetical protein
VKDLLVVKTTYVNRKYIKLTHQIFLPVFVDEVTDMLELMLYLSAENGSTSIIDKILGSAYGDLVKARCSGRIFQPHQVARKSRHVELSEYLKNKLNRFAHSSVLLF